MLAGRFRPQPTSPSLSGSWRCWASGYRPVSGLLAGAGYHGRSGVIIIIALFYTQQLSLTALAIGVVATLTLLWMNRRGEDRIGLYMLVGLVLWVAVLKSGVHATLAGSSWAS